MFTFYERRTRNLKKHRKKKELCVFLVQLQNMFRKDDDVSFITEQKKQKKQTIKSNVQSNV